MAINRLDLDMFKDRTLTIFNNMPLRCRLNDMVVDLTESERISLAYIESAIIILGQQGFLSPDQIEQAVPKVYTKLNESVNEE